MIRWVKTKIWVSRLNAADATMRAEAIRRLCCLNPPNLLQLLCELLKDAKRQVRLEATRALGGLGNSAIEGLITASGDADHEVRLTAAQRLIAIKPPNLLRLLCGFLNDPDSNVRLEATRALGGLGSAAIEGLTTALQDTSLAVRMSAAQKLGDMEDARAIDPLGAAITQTPGHHGGEMKHEEFDSLEASAPLIRFRGLEALMVPKTSTRTFGHHGEEWEHDETALQEVIAQSLFNLSKVHPLPFRIRKRVESILEARAIRELVDLERLSNKILSFEAMAFRERVDHERLSNKLWSSSPYSRGSSDEAMITSSR